MPKLSEEVLKRFDALLARINPMLKTSSSNTCDADCHRHARSGSLLYIFISGRTPLFRVSRARVDVSLGAGVQLRRGLAVRWVRADPTNFVEVPRETT